jgi:glycosyltransferase involved in cell wall biosynthesis
VRKGFSIAVLIPALNEAGSLPGVLADIPNLVDRIVVIDNGSTDGTGAVAAAEGADVVYALPKGYGTAVLAGIAMLRPDPPDVVVILDADHADVPQRIADLVDPILDGRADLVQIDRSTTAEPGSLTFPQRFGNRLATRLIRLRTGHVYRDMGPFRAIRWTSLIALHMEDPTWGWNVEMQMKAVHNGLRILEVPLPYRARRKGASKISGSLTGAARAGVRILAAVVRYGAPHTSAQR